MAPLCQLISVTGAPPQCPRLQGREEFQNGNNITKSKTPSADAARCVKITKMLNAELPVNLSNMTEVSMSLEGHII